MKKLIMVVIIFSTAFIQNTIAQTGSQLLDNVLNGYISVKNNLSKDKGDSVEAAAKVLFAAINKMPVDRLTSEQHTIWVKYSGKLSADAGHIKETSNIDHQREYFISLSKNMYAVITGFKANSLTLYYQYCPMANNGKGAYWLSESSIINNPYLGGKMPTCGSTKDTIKMTK